MKASGVFRLAVGAALVTSTMAAQAIVFGAGLNDIEMINRENNYRSNESCTSGPVGECLGAGTGPTGFQLVNPAIANNVKVGDIFVGVFAAGRATNYGVQTWVEDNIVAGGIDTFTGYFVQRVADIQLNVNGAKDRLILEAAPDPFGVLQAGEAARVFVDNVGLSNTVHKLDGFGLTIAQSITSVTDGALWASLKVGTTVLGAGVDTDGYITTEVDIAAPGNSNEFAGTFFTSWNLDVIGPAFNLGALTGINDPSENVKSGSQVGDPVSTSFQNAFGICNPAANYGCYDVVGNGQLNPNQNAAFSPWPVSYTHLSAR